MCFSTPRPSIYTILTCNMSLYRTPLLILDQEGGSVFLYTTPGTTGDRGARPRSPPSLASCLFNIYPHSSPSYTCVYILRDQKVATSEEALAHIFLDSYQEQGRLQLYSSIASLEAFGQLKEVATPVGACYIHSPPLLPVHPGGQSGHPLPDLVVT